MASGVRLQVDSAVYGLTAPQSAIPTVSGYPLAGAFRPRVWWGAGVDVVSNTVRPFLFVKRLVVALEELRQNKTVSFFVTIVGAAPALDVCDQLGWEST